MAAAVGVATLSADMKRAVERKVPIKPADNPTRGGGFSAPVSRGSTSSHSPSSKSGSVVHVGMAVSAFVDNPALGDPLATGRVTSKIAANVYAVAFEPTAASPVIEVGCRVVLERASSEQESSDAANTTLASGLIAKVHGNGMFAVLLDDDTFDNAVKRSQITTSEGRPKFMQSERYALVAKWVREAGVTRKTDCQSAASILFRRGWRRDTLYLLEPADVHCLSHLNKSVRMGVLEAADADRDHQRHVRESNKEALKDREWRYFLPKYSGIVGAMTAVMGAISVFTWNLKNWRKAQRPAQLLNAVDKAVKQFEWAKRNLAASANTRVVRGEEERMVALLMSLSAAHPRVVVLSGNPGCGKSTLCVAAAARCGMPVSVVEIRGKDADDPIRAIAKTFGVNNFDICGDLFDFVSDACNEVAASCGGNVPLIVMKMHGDQLGQAYDDAVTLACARHVAHVVIEVQSETMKAALVDLPHVENFHISEFTPPEAVAYMGHRVDPHDFDDFVRTIGTNSNDIDEFVSASFKGIDASDFIAEKLSRGIDHLRISAMNDAAMKRSLRCAAESPYDTGIDRKTVGWVAGPPGADSHLVDLAAIERAVGKRVLVHRADTDAWVFRSKWLHESSRIAFAGTTA
jgi:hypothetical protein